MKVKNHMSRQMLELGCIKCVAGRITTIFITHAERSSKWSMKNLKFHNQDVKTQLILCN